MTWKIVGASKASVLYIYIDNTMEKFFFFCRDKRVKLIPIETKEIELCEDN